MTLFIHQQYGKDDKVDEKTTFKDIAERDISSVFFLKSEFADSHTVDGREALVVLEEDRLKEHSSHWEGGSKQNFDIGLYTAATILYIKCSDYGVKPKIGKLLVLDKETDRQRTYTILSCEEEMGIYRMTMGRVRQH